MSHSDIRIGTLAGMDKGAGYIKQILPHGFESFSLTLWQYIGKVDLEKTAKEVLDTIGDKAVISSVGIYGNPLQDENCARDWGIVIDKAHLFKTNIVCGFAGAVECKAMDQSIPRYKQVFGELQKRAADKGVKIAFLGYSQFADLFFDWGYPRSFSATETLAGVPRIQDDWLAEDIKAARALAPVVAVAYHWGDEFQNYPNEEQQRIARLSVDLGADLVLGYHPHAIQGFEFYKGKFIAYSTGNFIMDRQDTDLARESMILDFTVAPTGVKSVSVLPVWIKAEQPYIMTGAEGARLVQKMRKISEWK